MWFITSIVMFIHNTHILIIFTIFENFKKDLFVKSNMQNTMHRPGNEPGPPAWQASILPLNQRCSLAAFRVFCLSISGKIEGSNKKRFAVGRIRTYARRAELISSQSP